MLRHYKEVEIPSSKGGRMLTITSELVDDPCARCGDESVPNVCAGDSKFHHHGRVHTIEGKLEALCKACGDKATREWKQRSVNDTCGYKS